MRENHIRHKDVLGSILLTMQACFNVMATKGCDGCNELSKTLKALGTHQEGWHVLDVYKPYRTRKTTVKTSSYCSNSFCYQLKSWTTAGTELLLVCQGRRSCKVMVDFGKLTVCK